MNRTGIQILADLVGDGDAYQLTGPQRDHYYRRTSGHRWARCDAITQKRRDRRTEYFWYAVGAVTLIVGLYLRRS